MTIGLKDPLAASITGNAATATTAGKATQAQYVEGNGRIASADLTHYTANNDVHMRLDIASSIMKTHKPAGDGFIQTYIWDNNGKYDTQIFFPNASNNNNSGHPQLRYLNGGDTWTDWTNLALATDFNASVYTATCSTAAATAAKVIEVPAAQNFVLKVGATIAVKFTDTNTANNPTFNVNSTNAKSIYYNTAVVTTSNLDKAGVASRYAIYTYDGTNWVWVSWSNDADTTYSNMSVSEGTTGTATTARTMRADYLKQIIEGVRPIDSTMSESSTNAIQNKVISTKVNQLDRFTRALVPFGTEIAANKNLNTLEFMKVQKFYCSTNATVATLTNCPTGGIAFMMEVFSPLSTTVDNEQTAWCYRTRIITDLNGNMYVQSASSNGSAVWSYGAWKRIAWKSEVDAKPNITMSSTDPGTGSTLAANNYIAVYGGSDASITTTDIVDGAVTNDKIAEGTIGASRLNNLSRFRAGEWVKIGEARVTTDTSGTAFMTVNIPSDYQSQHAQYKVEGAMEVVNVNSRQNFLSLQPMIGSTWMTNCFYSCQHIWGAEWAWYGASGTTGYNGTTAIFGLEWCFQSDWDSCDFSVFVSNAYPGSHWCASATAGGMSGGHPGTFTGGSRVQNGNALTGFRIQCGSAVTMGAGSTLTVYGRLRPTY